MLRGNVARVKKKLFDRFLSLSLSLSLSLKKKERERKEELN